MITWNHVEAKNFAAAKENAFQNSFFVINTMIAMVVKMNTGAQVTLYELRS